MVRFTDRWKQTDAQAPVVEFEAFGFTYRVRAVVPAIVPLIIADLQRADASELTQMTQQELMARGNDVLTAFRKIIDAVCGKGAMDLWLEAGASLDELRDVVFYIAAGYTVVEVPQEGADDGPLPAVEA
jgi:hypothetical protein